MSAIFSSVDDKWDMKTGLYGVIGRIEKDYPDIRLRYSVGGIYREIPVVELFETPRLNDTDKRSVGYYPLAWNKQVIVNQYEREVEGYGEYI